MSESMVDYADVSVDKGLGSLKLAEGLFNIRALYNIDGAKLSNCDVCWTCRWFDISSKECTPAFLARYVDGRYKEYKWYRCVFWEDGGR